MKLLRDELYDMVFSSRCTAGSDGQLQRVPYFAVLGQVHKSRNEKSQAIAAERDKIAALLDAEVDSHRQTADQLKQADERAVLAASAESRAQLEMQLMASELADLKSEHSRKVEKLEAALCKARTDIARLKADLGARQEHIQELLPFERLYKDLDKSFRTRLRSDLLSQESKRPEVSIRGVTNAALEHCRKTRLQLCTARNRAIDDFEALCQRYSGKSDEDGAVPSVLAQGQTCFSEWMSGFEKEISSAHEDETRCIQLPRMQLFLITS